METAVDAGPKGPLTSSVVWLMVQHHPPFLMDPAAYTQSLRDASGNTCTTAVTNNTAS